MSEFKSFINLVVKQTCRDFAHVYDRGCGWKDSGEENTTTYKYSTKYLKLLYENPDKHIHEIIAVPSSESSSAVDDVSEFTELDKQNLLIFFKNVNDMKPRLSRLWVNLQHYMFYVYRIVLTENPNPTEEHLPKKMRSHMRSIFVELRNEDKCQLYLRLFALLREYAIFAHWQFSKITDKNLYLPRLFHYYEAFLIAADSLRSVFKDFEIIAGLKNHLKWVDFNMCIFMHYFYELNDVQAKLCDFQANDSSSLKTVDMYNLLRTRFSELHGRWFTKDVVLGPNDDMIEIIDGNLSHTDDEIFIEVQNLLSQNFWMERTPDKAVLNTPIMEGQIFVLLGKTDVKISEPNLDKTGQCICEYCLMIKFKYLLGSDQHIPPNRQIPCPICEYIVILDNFFQHISEHEEFDDSTESDESPAEQFGNLNGELLRTAFMDEIKSLFDDNPTKDLADISQKKELTNGEIPNDNANWQLEHFFGFSNEEKENIENYQQDMNDIPTYNDFLTFQIALDNHIKNKKEGKANDALDALYFQEFLKHSMYLGQNWPENVEANPVTEMIPEPSPKIFAKPLSMSVDKEQQTVQKEVEEKSEVEQVKDNIPSEQPPVNPQPKPPPTLPCGHSCKHGEEVKSDLKKVCQGICDHHSKDAKKCDCTYCEVFGTAKGQPNPKDNVTRNRLRVRLLNQRKAKSKLSAPDVTVNTIQPTAAPRPVNPVASQPSINLAESTLYSKPTPMINNKNMTGKKKKGVPEDLKDQLHYIEGEQKSHAAEKKAAKKARQRQKKEEERLKKEEEQQRKEAEEAKLRAAQLARESAEQEKESKKDKKKKARNQQQASTTEPSNVAVYEETIPALVTIQRSQESNTLLTIKFQEMTINQDELLSSLVRQPNISINNSNTTTQSNTGQQQNESKKAKKNKQQQQQQQQQQNVIVERKTADTNGSKKKNKKAGTEKQDSSSVIANEVKITLSIPSQSLSGTNFSRPNVPQMSSKSSPCISASSSSNSAKQQNVNSNSRDSKKNSKQKNQVKENEQKFVAAPSKKTGKDDMRYKENGETCELSNLRLPPGITITKVNGPVSNRNYKPADLQTVQQNSSNTTSIPVSKSGVIVVDTEKLIQQTSPPTTNNGAAPTSRKSKKKKNKKQLSNGNINGTQNGQDIVTLKNPIYHPFQNSKPEMEKVPDLSQCQASIFKNENGMVTIRSSRLQQSLNNGTPMPNLLSELKPVIGPDVATPYVPPCTFTESNRISTFNAQEILSGLPGIEITKVDKCSAKNENDNRKSCQTAEVSIIPANSAEKFNMEKEDWHYDSVFTPKDILEDDMDADERELEAFKRFCQQSVPPKRKEKVAHLNVKDIVLKKKNDINSV